MLAMKLCECGCGEPAPIARDTWKKWGWVKGEPKRFIRGHSHKVTHPLQTHGMAAHGNRSPEWRAYSNAKDRCTNPHFIGWKYYGGRGIEFRFTSFQQFYAELGARPSPKHSIDRIDNNGHYEPGNVRWATREEQAKNQRANENRDQLGRYSKARMSA